jgi:adenylate kinase
MNNGRLVSDNLVCDMVAERLRQPDCVKGAVLDGFPRTIPQAQWLDVYLEACTSNDTAWCQVTPLVIKIDLDKKELLCRLLGRRSCPSCGRAYNTQFQSSGTPALCDVDGSVLITRCDDAESLICERLKIYEQETLPVAEHYRGKGHLHEIDGSRSVASVASEVVGLIRNRPHR